MLEHLDNAYMLYVDGKPTQVLNTLEAGKAAAAPYIHAQQDVSVQNMSGRIVEWYFDPIESLWIYTEYPGQRR
jgi:hypothetical protein